MTHNQIEYAKMLETRRSNKENERLTGLRDERAYEINLGNLKESERHNRASERQLRDELEEKIRINDLNYHLNRDRLNEDSRHNLRLEDLQSSSIEETIRSNLAREIETNRANIARESETKRSNMAVESETKRSHLANEAIGRSNVSLGYAQLNETTRANKERERLNRLQYSEQVRHSKAQEIELNRHNVAQESIGERSNVIATRNANTREYEAESARIRAISSVLSSTDDVARAATMVVDLLGVN